MQVNEKWQCIEKYVVDGKPTGLDGEPSKTIIHQEYRSEKHRMDYYTISNMSTGSGYHLKGFRDLVEHVKFCLSRGHVIEIIPDYKRPDDREY